MNFNIEERNYLKKVLEKSKEGMDASEIFLSIYTPNFLDGPECMLQIGYALMKDKPIGLLVIEGAKVSEMLKKVAFAIEYVKTPDDVQDAVKRIITKYENLHK